MKKWWLTCLLLLFPLAGLAALPAAVNGEPLPSLAPVLKEVTPSVVNIQTRTRVQLRSPLLDDPFFRRFFNIPDVPRERFSQSLGSGVIVDAEQGYILTNNHVIRGADDISVTLQDGRNLQGVVVGTDPATDLAVLRVPAENLRALKLADSELLQVGDFVVAVGNPFGLGQTVTSGIVSALGRAGFRDLEYQNFIQTDASINPGNSGGALINLRGELVGINSAIFTPSGGNVGIGFAIPSSMARYVLDQLVRYGAVRRGTLGLVVQDLTSELAGALGVTGGRGALVAEVLEGSPGARGGLEPGDVVVGLGALTVGSAQDFLNAEGQAAVDEEIPLRYLRAGQPRTASLVVQEEREIAGEDIDPRFAGARFAELSPNQRGPRVRGVLLSSLEASSRLAFEGLRPGDIITGVNRERISGLDQFARQMSGLRGPVLLQLQRNGEAYITRID